MAIQIVPHAEDKKDLVEAFNTKMRAAGSRWGFYVDPTPYWIPRTRDDQKLYRQLFLALENGEEVVGGYALKPQPWLVHGEERIVTDWQGPVSLGAIDNGYAALGLRLVRDMLKKAPLLYSWGHGGSDEPIVVMLRRMGWLMHSTPFLFRVCRPANFLRKNAYLREDPKKALAQDVLAFSGLGAIGFTALHAALRMKSLKRFETTAEVTAEFGGWADEAWAKAKGRYDAIAFRDATSMNALLPSVQKHTDWPEPVRLRVRRGGQDVGWAAVIEKQLEHDPRFGDMRVGMVVDAFGLPEDAGAIVWAAFDYLREMGVDMVMANHSHPGWVAGYEDAGFFKVEDRRIFCASPQLQEALEPFEQTRRGLFLSNLDGHGPMGL
ncbi:MAG: hypothetical protein H6719_04540 [Sandaracinaceae bacterium]|nr:hypothetical protein [Sandaracinaceae bacterium]